MGRPAVRGAVGIVRLPVWRLVPVPVRGRVVGGGGGGEAGVVSVSVPGVAVLVDVAVAVPGVVLRAVVGDVVGGVGVVVGGGGAVVGAGGAAVVGEGLGVRRGVLGGRVGGVVRGAEAVDVNWKRKGFVATMKKYGKGISHLSLRCTCLPPLFRTRSRRTVTRRSPGRWRRHPYQPFPSPPAQHGPRRRGEATQIV